MLCNIHISLSQAAPLALLELPPTQYPIFPLPQELHVGLGLLKHD